MNDGLLENKWRMSRDFLRENFCFNVFLVESALGILQWDGVRQVDFEEWDTCGLRYFSILSWITILDLLFAHASLITLTLPMILQAHRSIATKMPLGQLESCSSFLTHEPDIYMPVIPLLLLGYSNASACKLRESIATFGNSHYFFR